MLFFLPMRKGNSRGMQARHVFTTSVQFHLESSNQSLLKMKNSVHPIRFAYWSEF
jgi:hypothetical protein